MNMPGKSSKQKEGWISDELYKKILEVMPIPCVDVVVVSRGEFLLGKRKNKPARGMWWFIGGRIMKGESLERAALRHVKIETGISGAVIIKSLGTRGTMFRNSAQGPASHTINTIFLARVLYQKIVTSADSENSKLEWFSKIDKRWPTYVREVLAQAGFK